MWSRLCRFDSETGNKEVYAFPEGEYCSEPVFAPRGEDEASGWVLSQCYRQQTQTSFLAVFEGGSIEKGPQATVELTHHVPLSSHGYWQPASR